MKPKRPLALTLLTGILVIGGVASIACLFVTKGSNPFGFNQSMTTANDLAMYVGVIALLSLVLAWGLWNVKGWSRNAIIGIEVLYVAAGLAAFQTNSEPLVLVTLGIFLALLLVYVIFNRGIRRAFGV